MKAVGTKILVIKEEKQDTRLSEKLGGFEVPVGAGEYETYRIVSVGQGVFDHEINEEFDEGDIVATYPKPGHELTYEGNTYRVISMADILVVF